ncbi:M67 family metallopeptidase [Planctomycetales bacterium ZRK34]|nr:M67 family metallopeptidase [Planctomycetales bacterium ZRK34]
MTLELTAEHDRAMREHAERIYPHECCGFLLGDELWRVGAVVPAVNSKGEEERHNRFHITPEASMRAEKEARARGLGVIGHYHSHPDAPAIPSTPKTVSESNHGIAGGSDLENATWPGYAFVIVSVKQGASDELTCWNLSDDRSEFHPIPTRIVQTQETR